MQRKNKVETIEKHPAISESNLLVKQEHVPSSAQRYKRREKIDLTFMSKYFTITYSHYMYISILANYKPVIYRISALVAHKTKSSKETNLEI